MSIAINELHVSGPWEGIPESWSNDREGPCIQYSICGKTRGGQQCILTKPVGVNENLGVERHQRGVKPPTPRQIEHCFLSRCSYGLDRTDESDDLVDIKLSRTWVCLHFRLQGSPSVSARFPRRAIRGIHVVTRDSPLLRPG